jgi:hypothetical protein
MHQTLNMFILKIIKGVYKYCLIFFIFLFNGSIACETMFLQKSVFRKKIGSNYLLISVFLIQQIYKGEGYKYIEGEGYKYINNINFVAEKSLKICLLVKENKQFNI